MNRSQNTPSPTLRAVWPIEALEIIEQEPKQRTAIVMEVKKDFEQCFLTSGLAKRLVQNGTNLFVLIGGESENAHNALDVLLEDMGSDDVLTSWHEERDFGDIASFVASCSLLNDMSRILVIADNSTKFGTKLMQRIYKAICSIKCELDE